MLAQALKYCDKKNYRGLLVFPSVKAAKNFLRSNMEKFGKAKFIPATMEMVFASGAKIKFGYFDHPSDIQCYRGTEYQFIGLCGQISSEAEKFLRSRLRSFDPEIKPVLI